MTKKENEIRILSDGVLLWTDLADNSTVHECKLNSPFYKLMYDYAGSCSFCQLCFCGDTDEDDIKKGKQRCPLDVEDGCKYYNVTKDDYSGTNDPKVRKKKARAIVKELMKEIEKRI